jgi:GNAT superfamily N-acetyltransferase
MTDTVPITLRAPVSGDMGWVVHKHGVLYAREYGWDVTFEGMVAGLVADFVRNFDAARERCWIAEAAGSAVGSVFAVREAAEVARLRMLYVDPSVRGRGLGSRLVNECVDFARAVGYKRMVLSTYSLLRPAIRIYEAVGFTVIDESPHEAYGQVLLSQTWARDL